MPKINAEALTAVKGALSKYEDEINGTNLSPKSKETYIRRANNFVRWLEDDFEPGGTLKK